MKTLKYIVLGIIIILIIFSCNAKSNLNNAKQEIVLQSQGIATGIQLDESGKIISNRLKSLHIKNFEITQNNEKCQLSITLKDSLNLQELSDVLSAKGNIDFYLGFGKQEVITQLKKLDAKMLIENEKSISDILSLLGVNGSSLDFHPIIGLADSKDTAVITKCLNSAVIKTILPADLKFIWGRKADDQGKYDLYAISLNNSISGKMIKDATKSEIFPNKIDLNLIFNEEGSTLWKNLSGKNIGKCIAIAIDNEVYAAPMVRSEISNGSCIISGNYTAKEVYSLIAIIKNGSLPIGFQLMHN